MAFEFKKTEGREDEIKKILEKRAPIELAIKYPIEITMYGNDLPRKVEEIASLLKSKGLDCKHRRIEKINIAGLPYRYRASIKLDVTQSILPELLNLLKDVPSVHIRYLFAPPLRRRRRSRRE